MIGCPLQGSNASYALESILVAYDVASNILNLCVCTIDEME